MVKKDILTAEELTSLINESIHQTNSMEDAFTKLAVDTQYATIGKMYSDVINVISNKSFNYSIVVVFHKGEYEIVDFSGKTFCPKSLELVNKYFKQVIPAMCEKLKTKLDITDGVYYLTSLGCFVEDNTQVAFLNINPLAAFEITDIDSLSYILEKPIELDSKDNSLLSKHFLKE